MKWDWVRRRWPRDRQQDKEAVPRRALWEVGAGQKAAGGGPSLPRRTGSSQSDLDVNQQALSLDQG